MAGFTYHLRLVLHNTMAGHNSIADVNDEHQTGLVSKKMHHLLAILVNEKINVQDFLLHEEYKKNQAKADLIRFPIERGG